MHLASPESGTDEDGILLLQSDLEGNIIPTPDPIPTAKYNYTCEGPKCTGHSMTCLDWELGQAWRKWRTKYVDEEAVLSKLKEKFLTYMIEKRELYFYMGMHSQYPSWMIIGIYYPPKSDSST